MFNVSTLQNFKDSAEYEPLGRIEEIKQDLKYPLTPAKWSAEVLRNTLLAPNEQIDALYKEVFGIALTDKFLYGGVFSDAQIERLKEIAQQCPFEKGNAVYSARVLLAHVEVPYVNYYNDCEGGIKPIVSSARQASQNITNFENLSDESSIKNYDLIPNPNNGNFTILIPQTDLNSNVYIEIFDNMGKLINGVKCTGNTNFEYKNKLEAGIYLCKLVDNDVIVFTTKFIVLNEK